MNDLVSVCIPVYNGGEFLEDCLNSIVKQTYANIEILVIDDKSNDDSISIIKRFREMDARIRLVINDHNTGLVNNWNKCIEEAKGNWIKFVFQDDIMFASCVEKMLACCINNEVPVCICSRDFIIEDSTSSFLKEFFTNRVFKLEDHYSTPKKFTPSEFASLAKDQLFVNIIGEPIVLLFEKKCIERIGRYNGDLVQLVDYEFAMRLCLNTDTYFLPEKLMKFRVHSSSVSNNQNKGETLVKNRFIEPLLLFHEYMFSPYFKILRRKVGRYQLFKTAVKFYVENRQKFTIPPKMARYITWKYKGIWLIKMGKLFVK